MARHHPVNEYGQGGYNPTNKSLFDDTEPDRKSAKGWISHTGDDVKNWILYGTAGPPAQNKYIDPNEKDNRGNQVQQIDKLNSAAQGQGTLGSDIQTQDSTMRTQAAAQSLAGAARGTAQGALAQRAAYNQAAVGTQRVQAGGEAARAAEMTAARALAAGQTANLRSQDSDLATTKYGVAAGNMGAVNAFQAQKEDTRANTATSMANAFADWQMQKDYAKADEEDEETSVLDDKQGRR